MARGGYREGAGRPQAPLISPLLSSLSASQSLPRLTPSKHYKHSLTLPEMAEQTPLEFLPLMPYSTEPMESLLLKKNERWWTYLL